MAVDGNRNELSHQIGFACDDLIGSQNRFDRRSYGGRIAVSQGHAAVETEQPCNGSLLLYVRQERFKTVKDHRNANRFLVWRGARKLCDVGMQSFPLLEEITNGTLVGPITLRRHFMIFHIHPIAEIREARIGIDRFVEFIAVQKLKDGEPGFGVGRIGLVGVVSLHGSIVHRIALSSKFCSAIIQTTLRSHFAGVPRQSHCQRQKNRHGYQEQDCRNEATSFWIRTGNHCFLGWFA